MWYVTSIKVSICSAWQQQQTHLSLRVNHQRPSPQLVSLQPTAGMMGTLKQHWQVSQAFKNVYFNRTRNLLMDFDFTSESRQKQTRTNFEGSYDLWDWPPVFTNRPWQPWPHFTRTLKSGLAVAITMPFSTERLSLGKPKTAHCWMMTWGLISEISFQPEIQEGNGPKLKTSLVSLVHETFRKRLALSNSAKAEKLNLDQLNGSFHLNETISNKYMPRASNSNFLVVCIRQAAAPNVGFGKPLANMKWEKESSM